MIWNQDPELIKIGSLSIRWYGFLFALGIYLGSEMAKFVKNKAGDLNFDIDKLFIFVVAGTFFGARLGHCLFYEPDIYLADPARIFFVWEGGLASHGALIGVIISLFVFSKVYKVEFLRLCDLLAAPACFAGGMIRLGNLFNSEIIGNQTTVPWAVIFSRIDPYPRHPTQLYESIFYFMLCIALSFYIKKKNYHLKIGQTFGFYLLGTFVFRFCIEFLKIPQVNFERDMSLNMGQLLSLPLIAIGVYFAFFFVQSKTKTKSK
ncbi:MAG: prolipoprotein diacylglyceryl transferase [Bdellovibrionales bacterium]|nr:prolipoprotein diacylglyceryl transferase [Bdellovibrionales bacterium]